MQTYVLAWMVGVCVVQLQPSTNECCFLWRWAMRRGGDGCMRTLPTGLCMAFLFVQCLEGDQFNRNKEKHYFTHLLAHHFLSLTAPVLFSSLTGSEKGCQCGHLEQCGTTYLLPEVIMCIIFFFYRLLFIDDSFRTQMLNKMPESI